jgi:hypothetical protein
MPFETTFITPGVLPLWLDIGAVALGALFGATLANSRQAPLLGGFTRRHLAWIWRLYDPRHLVEH